MDGGRRQRNLRPRRAWASEDTVEEAHTTRTSRAASNSRPPRRLRDARAKVSGDFVVYDDEDDADWEKDADIKTETEPVVYQSRSQRRIRASRQATRAQPSPRESRRSERRRGESRNGTRGTANEDETTLISTRSSRSSRYSRAERRTRASRPVLSDRERRARNRAGIFVEEPEEEEYTGESVTDESDSSSLVDDDDDGLDEEDSTSDSDAEGGERRAGSRSNGSRRGTSRSSRRPAHEPEKPLPEDVPRRAELPQPTPDPWDLEHSPSVAFISIFVATFSELFPDLLVLPAPQDIEEGLMSPQPSELVENLYRGLMALVLNRKKDIEVGKYGSALSELHSLRNVLGVSPSFPLNWRSRSEAFTELSALDRVEILHVLIHWSLAASDRVRGVMRNLPEEAALPWMGADKSGQHYYIAGFDPLAEGSPEYTRFRVYRESNRLLNTVKWESVASDSQGVVAFLQQHVIKSEQQLEQERLEKEKVEQAEKERLEREAIVQAERQQALEEQADKTQTGETNGGTNGETNGETKVETKAETVGDTNVDPNVDTNGDGTNCGTNGVQATRSSEEATASTVSTERSGDTKSELEVDEAKPDVEAELADGGAVSESTPAEVKYNLPDTVVEILLNLLPTMQTSEAVRADRLLREEKRLRRKRHIQYQAEAIERGEGRYAGRVRQRRANFSSFANTGYGSEDDDSDAAPSKRRRVRRDTTWGDAEPETRQQRHARLMAERQERESEQQ